MYLFWPKGSAGAHQLLVLVCVVTTAKSFRVVCGNAHPVYLVLMRALLHYGSCANWAGLAHYSSQVERTDVLNNLLDEAHTNFESTSHPQVNLESFKLVVEGISGIFTLILLAWNLSAQGGSCSST